MLSSKLLFILGLWSRRNSLLRKPTVLQRILISQKFECLMVDRWEDYDNVFIFETHSCISISLPIHHRVRCVSRKFLHALHQ